MYSAAPSLPPWQARGTSATFHDRNAYIPVPARQAFSQQHPSTHQPSYSAYTTSLPPSNSVQNPTTTAATRNPEEAASAESSQRKKMVWSPDVRDYVQRSFAIENTINGVSKTEIEVRLKRIITEATQSGNLDSVNWPQLPLPQQMIQEEKNRLLLAPQPPISDSYSWNSPAGAPAVQNLTPAPPEPLRKRKSSELSTDVEAGHHQPPWRAKKAGTALEDRVSFAPAIEKRLKLDHGSTVSKSPTHLESRKKRFEDARSGSYSPQNGNNSRGESPHVEAHPGPIVGRSQKLEKNYFRLTSAPNPDDVRPVEVLRKTLDFLKKKWRSESNYAYICDQFKSLRQDLTVQHIKNEFTTTVYEIHARIALEKGDLGEYNQCQTQLRSLYQQKLGGHPVEFKAYRILYFIYTCNRTDMNDVLSDLTPTDKSEPAIKHALEVRSALALGNYHKFFKLYLSVPHMGAYLMDMFVARERLTALASICKSYKPDVKIRFITEELGFEHDEESARFILEYAPEELLEERDNDVRLLTGKAGSVFETARANAFKQVDIKGQI